MFYNAKNGNVQIESTDMDYISFGRGTKPLIMIPGVGDGFKTAKGMAIPFALLYRRYARDYRVYVFSRKNQLEPGATTKDMARDLKTAMEKLGVGKAHIVGISQGGMIAQHLAIDYPELVAKLVIVVSLARPNETLRRVVGHWITLAEARDYKGILIDSAEKSYSERYLKQYRLIYPFLSLARPPKDFSRFIIQANACICHDAYGALYQINCPTLVIGGDSDQIVGAESAPEIAARIPGSNLVVYKGLGHGTYEEAKDFHDQVIRFFGTAE